METKMDIDSFQSYRRQFLYWQNNPAVIHWLEFFSFCQIFLRTEMIYFAVQEEMKKKLLQNW